MTPWMLYLQHPSELGLQNAIRNVAQTPGASNPMGPASKTGIQRLQTVIYIF